MCSLEPGETPSNSASHQAPNYAQRSEILQKKSVAVTFFNLLMLSTVYNLSVILFDLI